MGVLELATLPVNKEKGYIHRNSSLRVNSVIKLYI